MTKRPDIDATRLSEFIRESNAIEGIHREPMGAEIAASEAFLDLTVITVDALKALVSVYEPGAQLRSCEGMDVRVGSHVAPPGGSEIRERLEQMLLPGLTPYVLHVRYEGLHPFTDGNGRSGRMIWLWQMSRKYGRIPVLGFLHFWYYQSLEQSRP